jgi:hypothetical protein
MTAVGSRGSGLIHERPLEGMMRIEVQTIGFMEVPDDWNDAQIKTHIQSLAHKVPAVGALERISGPIETIYTKNPSGKPLTTSKGGIYVTIMVNGQKLYVYDNMERSLNGAREKRRLFDMLEATKPGTFGVFLVETRDTGKGRFKGVKNVLQLGEYEWEVDGTEVLRRGAPPAKLPDWEPNNPDVTDSDIPW